MRDQLRHARAMACGLMLLAALPALAQAPRAATDPGQAAQVARMVRSFIEFSRWPERASPNALCVVGTATAASQLDAIQLADGRRLKRSQVAPSAVQGCDVVYLGKLDPVVARQVSASLRGKAVLTIAENDPGCRSQAMFCLLVDRQGLTFRLNVDSVSRSAVRVDPRVLRMARGGT